MIGSERRIRRERKTISTMIEMYCRDRHHRDSGPCPECEALNAYAMQRVDKCPYGSAKPTCANCPIHCYKPDMRERVRRVMRYAGPRMLRRHPVLAVLHTIDGLRKVDAPPRRRRPRTARH
ncbi:MAG: nitrous oxide-stimulated promoter family protein [Acidobacteriota bacterium]